MAKDFNTTLEKIKSRGYWKISIYPNTKIVDSIQPINKAKELAQQNAVQFRGWDYPHIPTQRMDHQAMYVNNDAIESWTDFDQFKEVWKLFNTGQFIHLAAVKEDWWEEDSWLDANHPLKKIKPGTVLEIIATIYYITEIYAFIRNMIISGVYKTDIVVDISLNNTQGRALHITDPGRAPLFFEYKAEPNKIQLPIKVYEIKDFDANYLQLAYDQIVSLCNQFNWDNPPLQVIKDDQKKLIERRI